MNATVTDISPIMSRSGEFEFHAEQSQSPLCENTPPRFSPVAHSYDYEYAKNPRPVAPVRRPNRVSNQRNSFDDNDTVTSVDTSFRRILLQNSRSIDETRHHHSSPDSSISPVSNQNTSGSAAFALASALSSESVLENGSATASASTSTSTCASTSGSFEHQVPNNPPQQSNTNRESDEERRLREEAESEALARALMAEEAMASYNQSTAFLQDHADQYSEEDLNALRAIMAEESPLILAGVEDGEDMEGEGEMGDSEELSYDALLNLGERIGDVKQERWALKAKDEIAKLPCKHFCVETMAKGKDENDSDVKCLVCQYPYENGEEICKLPCGHYFHKECISQWLMAKDFCPYCRQCIVSE